MTTYPSPDLLLSVEGERQVDSIHRHPVYLALPAFPVPPHERVAHRANVLVVAEPASDIQNRVSDRRTDNTQNMVNPDSTGVQAIES